jgi:hypothetical protein
MAALRNLTKKPNLTKIPIDTLIMNREALINMYGPTVAAIACLDDVPIKISKLPRAKRNKTLPHSNTKKQLEDKKKFVPKL